MCKLVVTHVALHRVGGPLPFNSGFVDITVAAVTAVITVILKTFFLKSYIIPTIDKQEKFIA